MFNVGSVDEEEVELPRFHGQLKGSWPKVNCDVSRVPVQAFW